jgi:nucleotide-binding universal stress UspA family protein
MTGQMYGIVAGYDGSPGAAQALRWAAREARARDTELTVCLAWTPDHMELPTESDLCDLARQHGQEILTRGLPYAESLLGRGHSELPSLQLGSVSWQVAGHACGRVVVVRGPWRPANQPPGPVLAGVDGSAAGRAAIGFAFEEATLRDVPLMAVCALTDAPGRLGEIRRIREDFENLMADEAKAHPEVSVWHHILPGTPRSALLAAAAEAQLLVVGARGRGGFDEMSLGSIAHAVLQYAPCPVAVVRP